MIETWRIAYRMMQELGIKFEAISRINNGFVYLGKLFFNSQQDRYRIAPDQIAPGNWCDIYRAAQALGVKFDYKTMENERWVEVGHSEPFMVLCFHRYRLHIEEPPKRTNIVNGVKVKAPDEILGPGEAVDGGVYLNIHFGKERGAEAFKAALEGKNG